MNNQIATYPSILTSTTPKKQGRCKTCGANLEALQDMLDEGKYSVSFYDAIIQIEKCPGCRSIFARDMR